MPQIPLIASIWGHSLSSQRQVRTVQTVQLPVCRKLRSCCCSCSSCTSGEAHRVFISAVLEVGLPMPKVEVPQIQFFAGVWVMLFGNRDRYPQCNCAVGLDVIVILQRQIPAVFVDS